MHEVNHLKPQQGSTKLFARNFGSALIGVVDALGLIGLLGAGAAQASGSVVQLAPRLAELVELGARVDLVANGFEFVEGPVWVPSEPPFLLFSDIAGNRVYRLVPGGKPEILIDPVKLDSLKAGGRGGSNGLALDTHGRLVLCEHGNRRVARLDLLDLTDAGTGTGQPSESSGRTPATLVDRYQGKRFNSPNDIVFRRNGTAYFTDPPYGLARQNGDPAKELDFSGIYRLDVDGGVHLESSELARPNGVGLSPDEKFLYVASSDLAVRVILRFPIEEDGSLGESELFFDARRLPGLGAPDGMAIDSSGNLWATGPGGVLVISPSGEHLGTIETPELPANVAFGEDGKSLFITARTGLYKLRTLVSGW